METLKVNKHANDSYNKVKCNSAINQEHTEYSRIGYQV